MPNTDLMKKISLKKHKSKNIKNTQIPEEILS